MPRISLIKFTFDTFWSKVQFPRLINTIWGLGESTVA